MTRAALFLMMFLLAAAARSDERQQRGEQVFNRSCTNSLCHAQGGGLGGGAPRLADRGFDETYIATSIRAGKAGTAMPSFEAVLSREDLIAVIAYVDGLNGVVPSANPLAAAFELPPLPPPLQLSAQAALGRALFADATRGVSSCSTCHRFRNQGIAVSEPIKAVPANVAALRTLQTPHVATIVVQGESMPALMVSRASSGTVFYDLTVAPPVLRSPGSTDVTVKEGSAWRHAKFTAAYSDRELEALLDYLRTAAGSTHAE